MNARPLLKKVVFLDRDGVINRDSSNYIKKWEEFEFLSGSLDGIRDLTRAGFTVIVITNQSVINRKMVTTKDLEQIFSKMKEVIASQKGVIKDIFYCPHTPEERCLCRKPKPGLILEAAEKYHIDLTDAVMVGDSGKDIECARNAGCGLAILVRTGNIDAAQKELSEKAISPDYVARDLNEAAEYIIDTSGQHPIR